MPSSKFTLFATLVAAAASGIAMAAPLYQAEVGTVHLSERGLADFQTNLPHLDSIVHLEARDPKKGGGKGKGGKGKGGKGKNKNKNKTKTTKTKKSKTSKTKKSSPTPTIGAQFQTADSI